MKTNPDYNTGNLGGYVGAASLEATIPGNTGVMQTVIPISVPDGRVLVLRRVGAYIDGNVSNVVVNFFINNPGGPRTHLARLDSFVSGVQRYENMDIVVPILATLEADVMIVDYTNATIIAHGFYLTSAA